MAENSVSVTEADENGWQTLSVSHKFTPNGTYSKIEVIIDARNAAENGVAPFDVDDMVITAVGSGKNLITNGDFEDENEIATFPMRGPTIINYNSANPHPTLLKILIDEPKSDKTDESEEPIRNINSGFFNANNGIQ